MPDDEGLAATMSQAVKALELLPEDDHFARSTAGKLPAGRCLLGFG